MGHYRLEFSKGSEVRFLAHLDLMRTFERSLRRAELPLAFSQGFNPHPKMSFASAVAVGVTSAKEYMDLELQEDVDTGELLQRLNKNLPPGIRVSRCIIRERKRKALMAEVAAASYLVRVRQLGLLSKSELEEAAAKLLSRQSVVVERKGKQDPLSKEIRPGILFLECSDVKGEWAEFSFAVQAGSEGNIRPEEVIAALTDVAGLPLESGIALIHRTGLFKKGYGDLMSV